MKLLSSISLPDEPWLEKWARFLRYKQADIFIEQKVQKENSTLIDFGCGQDILYHKYLRHTFPLISQKMRYIGIDPLLPKSEKRGHNVELFKSTFEKSLLNTKAEVITMFAVIEHVDDPYVLLSNACRLLKPGGILIATSPSPLAQLPLEFCCYILGIISKREIDEHKRYPTKKSLMHLVERLQKNKVNIRATHRYFELGLNNLLIIHRVK